MQTWILWTTQRVNEQELERFAEACGGHWNDAVGDEAIIERGDARVFLSSALSDDQDNVMADDVIRAAAEMGHVPGSMISMRIGHANGSMRLAEEVANRALNKWGGFLDRNEG